MTTAKKIRDKAKKDIEALQKTCKHKKKEWMLNEIRIGSYLGEVLVCLKCSMVLDRRGESEGNTFWKVAREIKDRREK